MTSTSAVDVARAALDAAGAGEAEAVALAERSALARFAGSEVHQPTLIDNVTVHLRVVRDGAVGAAATNRVDEAGLQELAARARAAVETAAAQPSFPGLARPEPLPDVEGYDSELAGLTAEDQARLVGTAIEAADGRVDLYGFYTSGVTELAVLTTTGIEAKQQLTDATTLVVAAGADHSGYAERTGWSANTVDAVAVAIEAVEKGVRTRGAHELEPGHYRAVLEPYALAELLQYFAWDSFNALGFLEGRSFLADRIGKRVFDPKITLIDDAIDPRGLPKAFDFEGVPKRRVPLIEEGVARGVVWDRMTAALAEDERETTGHAPPTYGRYHGPLPFALSLSGGEAGSIDELIDLVGDGIYITRLHYLSVVDPREGILTGMTRDGTFRIRDGKLAEPLVNLRFTVAVPEIFGDVLALTRDVRLVNASDFYGERYPYGSLVPALATASLHITGAGAAPGL